MILNLLDAVNPFWRDKGLVLTEEDFLLYCIWESSSSEEDLALDGWLSALRSGECSLSVSEECLLRFLQELVYYRFPDAENREETKEIDIDGDEVLNAALSYMDGWHEADKQRAAGS